MKRDYAYYKKAFHGIPKPFAFVDLDFLDDNIQNILSKSGSKNIRIASKSLRSVDVLKRILAADERFQGVMCYSPVELLHLADQQIDDLLMGYPIWEAVYLSEICDRVKQGLRITLMVDCLEQVERLEQWAQREHTQLAVCLDMDMSVESWGLYFGVRRSPIRSLQQILPLVQRIAQSKVLRLEGLMGYEAQIAGVGDAVPGQGIKNGLVRWLKKNSVREVAARRAQLVQAVQQHTETLAFINGGGTGSLATTTQEEWITEVTVGSGFFSPGLFDHYRDFRYLPAAGYAIEIVRQPAPQIYTCHGGGYVASGSVGQEKLPVPYLPGGMKLLKHEGAGEVQTPLWYEGVESLQLGDPVFMRHAKAGELCERFDRLYYVSAGRIVGEATTYRGDGVCTL